MRKKNLKPIITGSVLIIPVLLLSAGVSSNAKTSIPKNNTTNIKINTIKLPRITSPGKGIKSVVAKIKNTSPFKTSNTNVNSNKFNNNNNKSTKGSYTINSDLDFNDDGPIYENVLTIKTPSLGLGSNNKSSNTNSKGTLTKRPAYNPSKGKAPQPPSNVKPYKQENSSNKNSLNKKPINNNNSLNDDDDHIYEEINEPIYENIGNFNDPIYDMPN